VKHNEGAISCF